MAPRHAAHDAATVLVLGWLEHHGFSAALAALEAEAGLTAAGYAEEVAYLRERVLAGEWSAAEALLAPLGAPARGRAKVAVRRQAFLELVEQQATAPDAAALVTALKELEPLLPKKEFNELCYVMTLPAVQEHAPLKAWSVHGGRLAVFDELAGELGADGGGERRAKPGRLDELLAVALEALGPGASLLGDTADAGGSLPGSPVKASPRRPADRRRAATASLAALWEGRAQQTTAQGRGRASPLAKSVAEPSISAEAFRPAPEPEASSPCSPQVGRSPAGGRRGVGALYEELSTAPGGWACWELTTEPAAVRALAFSPNGTYIAIGSNARELKVLGLEGERAGRVALALPGLHAGSVFCAAWSASSTLVATGSNDHTVTLTRLRQGGGCSGLLCTAGTPISMHGHTGTVRDVCFAPYADAIVSGGAGDFAVRVWDTERAACLGTLAGHDGQIIAVRPAADGRRLLSASADGELRYWDPRARACVAVMRAGAVSNFSSVAVDPAGQYVAVGDAAGCVHLLDAESGRVTCEVAPHTAEVRSLDFAPGGGWLLSGSFDRTVAVLKAHDGHVEVAGNFERHSDRVVQARWASTRVGFASSGSDRVVKLWSPAYVPAARS